MYGVETVIDLLMIAIRWLAVLLSGGEAVARWELLPAPVRADYGPRRGGCYPTNSPGVGWITMRLDPVSWPHVLSRSASARGARATCPRSLPPRGA